MQIANVDTYCVSLHEWKLQYTISHTAMLTLLPAAYRMLASYIDNVQSYHRTVLQLLKLANPLEIVEGAR